MTDGEDPAELAKREVLGNLRQLVTGAARAMGPGQDALDAAESCRALPLQVERGPVRFDDRPPGDSGPEIGPGPLEQGPSIEANALDRLQLRLPTA